MKCYKRKKTEKITEDTVRYVAGLSRLSFDDNETARFRAQLESILHYIDKLNEVETGGVQPTTHALPTLRNVFREDVPGHSLSSEEALANAPSAKDDMFVVPKIIKDN